MKKLCSLIGILSICFSLTAYSQTEDQSLKLDVVKISDALLGKAWDKYNEASDSEKLSIYPAVMEMAKMWGLARGTYYFNSANENAVSKCAAIAKGFASIEGKISSNISKIVLSSPSQEEKQRLEAEISVLLKQKDEQQNKFSSCLFSN